MRFTKPPMRCHSLWYMRSCKYFIREIHHQILMLPLCMKYTRLIPDIYRKYTRNTPEIIRHHPRRNTPHLCQKYTRFIREESQPLSQVYTCLVPNPDVPRPDAPPQVFCGCRVGVGGNTKHQSGRLGSRQGLYRIYTVVTVIWPHFAHRLILRTGLGLGSGQ
jgi:hypothetical protein